MERDQNPETKGQHPRQDPRQVEPLIPLEPLLPQYQMDPLAVASLEPGETLLWTGRSASLGTALWREMCRGDRWPLGCLAYACLSTLPGMAVSFPAIPAPWANTLLTGLVALPLYAVVAALLARPAALREAGVVYAITDRRILRIRKGRPTAVPTYLNIDPLSVSAEERAADTGALRFAMQPAEHGTPPERMVDVGLCDVLNVRAVERLLLAAVLRRHIQPMRRSGTDERMADQVRAGLRAKSTAARMAAIGRLLQMDAPTLDAVVPLLGVSPSVVRALGVVGMWRPIGAAGGRAIRQALAADPSAPEHQAGTEALRRLGRAGVGSLIQAAGSDDPPAVSLYHLHEIEAGLLGSALADVLLTEDPSPGIAFAEAMGSSGHLRLRVVEEWLRARPPAVDPLLALLRGSGYRACFWAAEALARMVSGEAAVRIRAAADGAGTRDYAVAVLRAHLGDASGGETLLDHFQHGDLDVRQVAAEAMGMLGDAGVPYLRALRDVAAQEWDQDTRRVLERAISRIEDALRTAPTELESASAPAGSGTELEAGAPPAGTGAELEAGGAPGPPTEREASGPQPGAPAPTPGQRAGSPT